MGEGDAPHHLNLLLSSAKVCTRLVGLSSVGEQLIRLTLLLKSSNFVLLELWNSSKKRMLNPKQAGGGGGGEFCPSPGFS